MPRSPYIKSVNVILIEMENYQLYITSGESTKLLLLPSLQLAHKNRSAWLTRMLLVCCSDRKCLSNFWPMDLCAYRTCAWMTRLGQPAGLRANRCVNGGVAKLKSISMLHGRKPSSGLKFSFLFFVTVYVYNRLKRGRFLIVRSGASLRFWSGPVDVYK